MTAAIAGACPFLHLSHHNGTWSVKTHGLPCPCVGEGDRAWGLWASKSGTALWVLLSSIRRENVLFWFFLTLLTSVLGLLKHGVLSVRPDILLSYSHGLVSGLALTSTGYPISFPTAVTGTQCSLLQASWVFSWWFQHQPPCLSFGHTSTVRSFQVIQGQNRHLVTTIRPSSA